MASDKTIKQTDGGKLYHVEVRRVFGGAWERVGSNVTRDRAEKYVAEHDPVTPGEYRIIASDGK